MKINNKQSRERFRIEGSRKCKASINILSFTNSLKYAANLPNLKDLNKIGIYVKLI